VQRRIGRPSAIRESLGGCCFSSSGGWSSSSLWLLHHELLSLLDPYPKSLRNGWDLGNFQGGCFRDIGSELGGKFFHVVSEERGLAASTRDGNVSETVVEQLGVGAGIGVDENAVGGESLRTVAGNGVAVVEMAMLAGVELDLAIVVEAGGDASIGMDGFDGGQVAIGDAEHLVGRGELDAVAYGELAISFAVDANASETTGIVGSTFSVSFLDRKLVGGWVAQN
jgi:hypothetical protein